MSKKEVTTWKLVDEYIESLLVDKNKTFDKVIKKNERAGLPPHSVSPTQGKLLQVLVKSHKAKNILEIGTLGAYSTIWLAQGLPTDGKLVTLEINPSYAEVAQSNIIEAGLQSKIEVKVGVAIDLLSKMYQSKNQLFDFVFIDADKENNPQYFKWALKLTRPGALIVADNVIRDGLVLNEKSDNPSVLGIRKFNELIAKETRVTATEIQTVGSKGYDGFAFILVLE